jgi:cell envelope opacity-associated protein A
LLYFLLQCYVERPMTTAAIIVLPRVLQKKWSRPSRYVVEVGSYQRDEVPFAHRSLLLTIPVVLLLIPFHVRHTPDDRLDSPPTTALRQLHRQQAALVRGVLEALEG